MTYLAEDAMAICVTWAMCLGQGLCTDLKARHTCRKDPESKQQLQAQLSRIEQQIKEEQRRRQQQDVLKTQKVNIWQLGTSFASVILMAGVLQRNDVTIACTASGQVLLNQAARQVMHERHFILVTPGSY